MTSSKPVNRVSPHYHLRNPELSVLLYITCFQSKRRRYQGLCEQKQPINPVRSSHGESKVLAGSTVCLCTPASVCLISDVWTSNTTTCPSNGPQRLDRPRFRLFSRLLTKSKPKLPLGWPRFDLFSWDPHSPSNEPCQLERVNDLVHAMDNNSAISHHHHNHDYHHHDDHQHTADDRLVFTISYHDHYHDK